MAHVRMVPESMSARLSREWDEKTAYCIENGYPLIVSPPSEGWYRRHNMDMAYLWTADWPLEPIRRRLKGYEMVEEELLLMIFVPSPQDQPGVPERNDWLKGPHWAKGDVWSL